jgi:predicted GNAT family N-acyltransferase
MLETLCTLARSQGPKEVFLSAQIRALSFYVAHGFTAQGEVFIKAGIPQRQMKRELM